MSNSLTFKYYLYNIPDYFKSLNDDPIGILRFNPDVSEPVMLTQACELSSFGFFQRGTYVFSTF